MNKPREKYCRIVKKNIWGGSSPGAVVAVYDPDAVLIHEVCGESCLGANYHRLYVQGKKTPFSNLAEEHILMATIDTRARMFFSEYIGYRMLIAYGSERDGCGGNGSGYQGQAAVHIVFHMQVLNMPQAM